MKTFRYLYLLFYSFPHFRDLKNVCVMNKYILTRACVLRIYMEILENLVSLIKTLRTVYPSI